MTHTPTSPAIDMDALRHEYREAAADMARLRAKLARIRDAGGTPRATVTVDKRTAELVDKRTAEPVEPLELVTLPVAHLRMLFESCARDGLSRGWHAAADRVAQLEHAPASIRGPYWAGLAAEVAQLATVYTDTAVAL